MINVLVVTLGDAAVALKTAAEQIIGKRSSLSCFSVDWAGDLDHAKRELGKRLETLRAQGQVLILTDMFGASSTNIALQHLQSDQIEVVTGVNLPMIVKALTLPKDLTLAEAASRLKTLGERSIYIGSKMF